MPLVSSFSFPPPESPRPPPTPHPLQFARPGAPAGHRAGRERARSCGRARWGPGESGSGSRAAAAGRGSGDPAPPPRASLRASRRGRRVLGRRRGNRYIIAGGGGRRDLSPEVTEPSPNWGPSGGAGGQPGGAVPGRRPRRRAPCQPRSSGRLLPLPRPPASVVDIFNCPRNCPLEIQPGWPHLDAE